MSYRLAFTRQAERDAKKVYRAGLKKNVTRLLGDLEGAFSRRISIQHWLVYQILELEQTVKVIRLWTQYE